MAFDRRSSRFPDRISSESTGGTRRLRLKAGEWEVSLEQVESMGVEELEKMASRMYGALVKAVVDVRLGRVVVG